MGEHAKGAQGAQASTASCRRLCYLSLCTQLALLAVSGLVSSQWAGLLPRLQLQLHTSRQPPLPQDSTVGSAVRPTSRPIVQPAVDSPSARVEVAPVRPTVLPTLQSAVRPAAEAPAAAGGPAQAAGELAGVCADVPLLPKLSRRRKLNLTAWKIFDAGYYLNQSIFEDSWVDGDISRMEGFMRKIARREPVRVVAWGNSFAFGAGCAENMEGREENDCSWPHRLRRWFEDAFPQQQVLWENRAWHGLNSLFLVSGLGGLVLDMEQKPDVVMLDFTVSDSQQLDHEHIYEALIRTFHELLPQTQLVSVEDGCGFCLRPAVPRRQIAKHYKLPLLDYAKIVEKYGHDRPGGPERLWPSRRQKLTSKGGSILGSMWSNFEPETMFSARTANVDAHPPWPVHQYYADLMAAGWLRMFGQVCSRVAAGESALPKYKLPEPTVAKADLDKYVACLVPLARYNALNPPADTSLISVTGNWTLYEDRKDRPGWISEEPGSVIRFPIKLGSAGTVAVTYLRSYEGVGFAKGVIELKNGKESRPDNMVGPWSDKISIPYTQILYASIPGINNVLDRGEVHGLRNDKAKAIEAFLKVTLQKGPKFKIVAVTSC